MRDAIQGGVFMTERMTWKQIQEKYPDQKVCS